MSALMAHVAGVGVFAPGWPDWASARAGLRGDVAIPIPEDIDRYPSPAGLPRNERRRTSPITRIAFAASEDALANTDCARGDLRSVFASCSGDMDIVDDICRALTEQPVALSPTQFHNSVHNASAGYWRIDEPVGLRRQLRGRPDRGLAASERIIRRTGVAGLF